MGFDISNHAVNTKFLLERLIPALTGTDGLDAFFDRAARICAVADRANQWGLRVVELDHDIRDRQSEAAPERVLRRPGKAGFLKRLMGKPAFEEIKVPAMTSGIPGFDSDMSVWGRPFFIVADTVDESLDAFERYLACASSDPSAVDDLARTMIGRLDGQRGRAAPDLEPAVRAVLDTVYPLGDHLSGAGDAGFSSVDIPATRQRLTGLFALYRRAWQLKDTDEVLEDDALDEAGPASEIALSIPYGLINLSAQVLPGWMGRGQVWPTALFDRIGVRVSQLFEQPTALFEPLVRALPALEERFAGTIVENYSLGGYVRPENVAALAALLQRHERDLILAWSESAEVTDEEVDEMAADYRKIIEPVTLAQRKGYGFLEAAEVYSGFLGVMN